MINRTTCFALIATLLTWSGMATAALDIVEDAYELDISDVQLPASSAGQVVIRQCDANNCDVQQLSVDQNTTYHVGESTAAVPLSDFRQAATGINKLIYVFYSVVTETVTRIVLSTASEGS